MEERDETKKRTRITLIILSIVFSLILAINIIAGSNQKEQVLLAGLPTIIDFGSDCYTCTQQKGYLDTIKEKYTDNININKIDIYDNPKEADKYDVKVGNNIIYWDGYDDKKQPLNDGIYTYKIFAVDYANKSSNEVIGTINIDKTSPTFANISVTPNPFVPNGNNILNISYISSEKSNITVDIKDNEGNIVSTVEDNILKYAGSYLLSYNCKDSKGDLLTDGEYTVEFIATDLVGLRSVQYAKVVIDRFKPIITNISSAPEPFLPSGENYLTISFDLSEVINTGSIKIFDINNKLISGYNFNSADKVTWGWNGKDTLAKLVPVGTYTYKINSTDLSGKVADQFTGTITVIDAVVKSLGISPSPFNPKSNTANISYYLSSNANTTVQILNSNYELVNSVKEFELEQKGANNVIWDGKNESGNLVNDGLYICKVEVTSEDGYLSKVYQEFWVEYNNPSISNENVEYLLNYPDGISNFCKVKFDLSEDSNVTIKVFNNSNNIIKTMLLDLKCNAGNIEVDWDGTNDNGQMVLDGTYNYEISGYDKFGKSSQTVLI